MLTTSLIALDATIIATAVPSIVDDLGGFSQFPWLFSIYLLTQAVTVPLYGKLADMVGRKPIMLFGIAVFLLGSVLCGVAWSMPALIVARAVQGIGAGAIQPIGITVVGDLYSVEERARVQGYIASVWGISSVLGPALGGLFSEYLTWRWIFLINLPLGALAAWMLARSLREDVVRRKHRVDCSGAVLLMVGCSLLILGLLEGGVSWAWTSPTGLGILGVGGVAIVAFLLVERRAEEPVLPLWVLRRRVLVGGNLVALTVGALLMGITSYVPTYVQGVLGTGAVAAGFAVAALTLGWPIAAGYSGRIYLRIGFRDTALMGSVLVITGALMCSRLGAESAVWEVAAGCAVMGIGLGFASSPIVVAIQSVVGWDRRGVVTGTNMFCRAIGSAIGAAAFGAIANATLASRFADPPSGLTGPLPEDIDDTALVLRDSPAASDGVLEFVRESLAAATHNVFLGLVVVSVLTLAALLLMPRRTTPLTFDP
jgi:EmrB/QacA subfamily drug resistance transporter